MLEDKDPPNHAVEDEDEIEIEFVDDDGEPLVIDRPDVVDTEGDGERPMLEGEIERLSQELEQLREMYLRKLAEFDNFRKRTDREREEFQKIAGERLIKELLPVLDNFERALNHGGEGDPGAFRDGIQMISRQLWDLLEREGLKVIDPEGELFDPEQHEAVQRIEDPAHEPGRVVVVMAKGYALAGRLLRPAMVGVAVELSHEPVIDGSAATGSEEGAAS